MTSRSGLKDDHAAWMVAVRVRDGLVTASIYNPQSFNGSRADTRTKRIDLRLAPADVADLAAPHLALVMVTALRDRLLELYPRPEAPAPLDRGHGVEPE